MKERVSLFESASYRVSTQTPGYLLHLAEKAGDTALVSYQGVFSRHENHDLLN